jgi:UDP:flavonoid glycosyltransferase YjiC (YdhE family)
MERLPADTPIVYASLGTHTRRYRWSESFFNILGRVAHRRQDLFFVVAIGKGRQDAPIATPPDNMIVVDFAPQLRIVRLAALVITNGGLGTIKECILSGTPMLVLPCRYDQPGNSARVVYHNLGAVGVIGWLSADRLSALIDRVLTDDSIKESARRMQALCEAARDGELEGCMEWLEAQAAGKTASVSVGA